MGIHGDDVVRTIRSALNREDCPTGRVRCYPRELAAGETPTNTWRTRDGRLEFDCAGRDLFRGFRITVEAIPIEDADWASASDEWEIIEKEPT